MESAVKRQEQIRDLVVYEEVGRAFDSLSLVSACIINAADTKILPTKIPLEGNSQWKLQLGRENKEIKS